MGITFEQVRGGTSGNLVDAILSVGSRVKVKGYFSPGGGGGGPFVVKDPFDPSLPSVIDELGHITLANGNIAVVDFKSPIDVRRLGADMSLDDNSPSIQAAYNYSKDIKIVGGVGQSEVEGEFYKITTQINVPSFSSTLIGQGTSIKAIGCNGFVSGISNEFVVIEGGKIFGDFITNNQIGVHVIGNPRSFTLRSTYIRAFASDGSIGVKIENGGGFTFKPTLDDVVAESCHVNFDIEGNSILLNNSFGRFSQSDALKLTNCAGVVINGGGYENPTAAIPGQVGLNANNVRIMTINSTYFENNKEHNVYMEDCYAVTINSALSANITEISTQVKFVNCEGVKGKMQVQNIDANEIGIEFDDNCIDCDLMGSTYLVVNGTNTQRILDLSTPQGTNIPVLNGGVLPNGVEMARDEVYFLEASEAVATNPEESLLAGKDGWIITFLNVGDHTITIRNGANTNFWRLGVDFQLTPKTPVQLVYSKELGLWTEL